MFMFMFKTIQKKTFVILISFFIVFLAIHVLSELQEIKTRSFNTLDKMNTTLNSIITEYTSAYIYNKDIKNIQTTIDAIDSDYVKSIYILDENANIIVESKKLLLSKIRHPKFNTLLKAKNQAIKNTQEYFILNTFSILDIPIGYMILEADLKTYHTLVDKEINEVLLDAVLWFISFLILSLVIARTLSLPIYDIIDKLKATKDNEVLDFSYQTQKEFQYLCENIAKTHNGLRISNKNLETKVNEKTYELQELNSSLENKVKEEVEKNRLQQEQMLQQSRQAQMGEMLSMIAHQWRQPLGAISSTSIDVQMKIELEKFDLDTNKGQEEQNIYFSQRLKDIDSYVNNLTTTIDDFRNFYKPNKQTKTVNLKEVISKSLSIIKATLTNNKIEIIEEYNSTQKIKVYENELMQVILNILKNAQDNFKEKETENPLIKITTENKIISICDNGGGIPEDIIEKIFDPYFSTKDEKNGTGLGLYMSRTIVEEHHKGKLNVKNIDNATCFIIEIGDLSQ